MQENTVLGKNTADEVRQQISRLMDIRDELKKFEDDLPEECEMNIHSAVYQIGVAGRKLSKELLKTRLNEAIP